MNNKKIYQPDYAVHPGETLREKLEELRMPSKEFAVRTGKPAETISKILSGRSSITPEMAVQFEKVLGISAKFWIKKQSNYNEFTARQKHKEEIKSAMEWAKNFPYPQMVKIGLVKGTRKLEEKAEELLEYFNISKPDAWENIYFNKQTPVYFRISLKHAKDPYALSALLQMGEIKAGEIKRIEFNKTKLKEILPQLKHIMALEPIDFLRQIQKKCLSAGIKVVYTPNLPKTVVHGTVRWIDNVPVLQMTDRLKRYDVFWFSFFHEIGHILLHNNKKNIFLEEVKANDNKDKQEKEADNFAAKWLLTDDEYSQVINAIELNRNDIKTINFYAEKFKTHKDIIIGRILHHNKNLYKNSSYRNKIKTIDFNKLL